MDKVTCLLLGLLRYCRILPHIMVEAYPFWPTEPVELGSATAKWFRSRKDALDFAHKVVHGPERFWMAIVAVVDGFDSDGFCFEAEVDTELCPVGFLPEWTDEGLFVRPSR